MALDFKVEYCIREKDGTLTVRVLPLVDGNAWEKSIEAQGKTADELEAALRVKLTAFKEKYDAAQSLTKTAEARLDVIKADLGLTGA